MGAANVDDVVIVPSGGTRAGLGATDEVSALSP
jgi:hypothetical protein